MSTLNERNAAVLAAPRVRAAADRSGVELGSLKGTGVAGRITLDDVSAAAAKAPGRRSAAARLAPQASATVKSLLSPATTITIDPYARNPLLADARQTHPMEFAAATAEGPAPTLFAASDLPAFIASGADPSLLLSLPWWSRHPAAVASAADFTRMLDAFGVGNPWTASYEVHGNMADGGTDGSISYITRFQGWLYGATPEIRQAREDAAVAAAQAELRQMLGLQGITSRPIDAAAREGELASMIYDVAFGDQEAAAEQRRLRSLDAERSRHQRAMTHIERDSRGKAR